jgi:hypothetical protein
VFAPADLMRRLLAAFWRLCVLEAVRLRSSSGEAVHFSEKEVKYISVVKG